MKKQILLAAFLLYSTAAFSSEQEQEKQVSQQQQQVEVKQTSEAQVLAVLQKDNASLREELRYANSPAYFKNTVIFLLARLPVQ